MKLSVAKFPFLLLLWILLLVLLYYTRLNLRTRVDVPVGQRNDTSYGTYVAQKQSRQRRSSACENCCQSETIEVFGSPTSFPCTLFSVTVFLPCPGPPDASLGYCYLQRSIERVSCPDVNYSLPLLPLLPPSSLQITSNMTCPSDEGIFTLITPSISASFPSTIVGSTAVGRCLLPMTEGHCTPLRPCLLSGGRPTWGKAVVSNCPVSTFPPILLDPTNEISDDIQALANVRIRQQSFKGFDIVGTSFMQCSACLSVYSSWLWGSRGRV